MLEKKLYALGKHTGLLDGDVIRAGLNKDLGVSDADQAEGIRRVVEVAKLMLNSGQIVLVALNSALKADSGAVQSLVEQGEFFEISPDVTQQKPEQAVERIVAHLTGAGAFK